MIRNYLKVAFRNLWKNRGFSFINITGLAIGMASAILIFLWIQDEIHYEMFHEKKDRIYEAWNRATFSGELHCWNTTPKVLARTLQHDFPEVEHSVRVNWPNAILFSLGEKRITAEGNAVDSVFLQVFSFPLLKGDPQKALQDPHSIILTEKLANKLFGKEDAYGKMVRLNNKEDAFVSGIAKDPPASSRFQFEYLLPWAYLRRLGGDEENWGNNSTRTYVLLKTGASLASVAPKLKVLKPKYDPSDLKWEMFLYPLDRWRLYSYFTNGKEDGGKITFVKLFGIIAGFVLLIACINFMNLSTARSEKRAKEVGIRKVVGAQKISLVGQFMGESVLLALMAGTVAFGIVLLSLSSFNTLTDKKLSIEYGNPYLWLTGLGFVLFTGILAGSYPAFFLSSFQPVKVLKGTFKAAHALITPRKILVVLQFTFAIILIICTFIVKQQIDFARDREIGYDKHNLIYHFLTGDIDKNFTLIKNELLSSGVASSVSKTSAPLTQGWSDTWDYQWQGKDPNDKTDIDRYSADEGLGTTAGFQFVKGRDFNLKEFPTDSLAALLNESAVRTMNFKEPVGQIIRDNDMNWHVVGVIRDFILQSPYYPTKPMVIQGGKLGFFNVMHIKLNSKNSSAQNIKITAAIFKKYNPEYPFEYHFVDEEYARKFEDEKRTATLAALFAGLTIFISCLGLFGLATYMAENRIKEIGVRKVLGASVSGIAALLSGDFLKLVLISFLIATPLAWWGIWAWLLQYPYHVSIHGWVFAMAGLLSVSIAIATVSYQAKRAAIANPVISLRTE